MSFGKQHIDPVLGMGILIGIVLGLVLSGSSIGTIGLVGLAGFLGYVMRQTK